MMTKKILITSGDHKISAVIDYPKRLSKKLAVLCPGFLDSKDYSHLAELAKALTENGYTVLRFDPTGTWGSGGDISQYTTTQYLMDVESTIQYMLKKRPFQHILIGGHSRGGQIALLYAARDPHISIVLAIMPSSNVGKEKGAKGIADWESSGFRVSYRDLPANRTEKRVFKVPVLHLKDLRDYNVIRDVKRINIPVILVAGESDVLCPPEAIGKIFDNANNPKRLITIPKIGHDYRHKDREIKIVNAHIMKILKETEFALTKQKHNHANRTKR